MRRTQRAVIPGQYLSIVYQYIYNIYNYLTILEFVRVLSFPDLFTRYYVPLSMMHFKLCAIDAPHKSPDTYLSIPY